MAMHDLLDKITMPNGEVYVPQVFLINTKRNGKPSLCTLLDENGEIDTQGDEEFLIAYVPERMIK